MSLANPKEQRQLAVCEAPKACANIYRSFTEEQYMKWPPNGALAKAWELGRVISGKLNTTDNTA